MKQAIATVFDRTAATYDRVIPYFGHFGGRIVEAAGVQSGDRVLDVCCGLGALLLPAAHGAGPDGHVVGVDLAPGMVDQLRRLISDEGLGNADVQVMDAEALDFDDAGFDVVMCGFGIMFLPHLVEALRGFHRVLRQGGRTAVAVWTESSPDFGFVGRRAKEFGGFDFKGDRPPPWADAAGLATLLESAGFHSVRFAEPKASFEFSDAATWWRWERSHGALALIDSVPETRADAFREAVLRDYADVADAAGRTTLIQHARIAVAAA